ncbi:hypothetical protein QBC32DRAFT_385931 [Pseudoneurospora amorphoporcata]|uniref:Uncharacterized protein n=1 Tax=Pseudoneurospora amorphoporcata TaxID=241081 RepID=A0AAN6SBH7_9PEZI|nr:hypothetical protein QBC32DRAFT_385931 [Pseudoneurospora amorphoporcata]
MGRGSFSSDGSSDAGGAQLDLFSPPPKGNQHWRSGSVSKTYKTDTPDTDTFPSLSSDSEKRSGGARPGGHSRHSSMASAVSMHSSHSRSSSGTYVGNSHGQVQPFNNFQPGASHHPSSSRPPHRYKTPDTQVTPPNKVQHLENGLSSVELTRNRDHPAIFDIRKHAADANRRLMGLKHAVDSSSHVPTQFRQGFDVDITQVLKNLTTISSAAESLAHNLGRKSDECESLRDMLSSQTMDCGGTRAQLEAEREQIRAERARMLKLEVEMKAEKDKDEKVIKALQEQIAGKRHLWMQVRKDPEERAMALEMLSRCSTPYTSVTDSSASPTPTGPRDWQAAQQRTVSSTSRPPRSGHNLMPGTHYGGPIPRSISGFAIAQAQRQFGSRSGHRSHSKGTGRVVSEWGSPVSRRSDGSGRGAGSRSNQPGGGPPTAIFMHPTPKTHNDDGPTATFCQQLTHLLTVVIRAFTHKYFAKPMPEVESRIRKESSSLFFYMCDLVYPGRGRKIGESHVSYLLNDDVSRPYLVERLLVQYIVTTMLQSDGWTGYEPSVDKEMASLSARLKDTTGAQNHSKTHERQAMVDRQAELVKKMVDHPKWAEFKNYKVNDHYQRFKKMVGPFLPPGPKSDVRDEALFDLFSIAEKAWAIAQKGWESRMTYVYLWSETCSKFMEASHHAVNSDVSGLVLQQRQMRISLVVTPGVTMRDDSRGMNIGTKLVRRSDVLVMV